MIGKGENVAEAPWSLFEELLCIKCALHMGEKEDINTINLANFYNKIVLSIKDNSIKLPKDESIVELQKLDQKEQNAVDYLVNKLFRDDVLFKEQMKHQIELNVK